ncbi:MAG: hypothetical protein MZW92_48055 [Comamonadaceae bacterium]|nr:hypothetical protein [Comamonadaceae bacterium]
MIPLKTTVDELAPRIPGAGDRALAAGRSASRSASRTARCWSSCTTPAPWTRSSRTRATSCTSSSPAAAPSSAATSR